jgi:flagellar biogenesis protein FliO
MKNNFKKVFMVGMIIPVSIFIIFLSVIIMYRVHSYKTNKKEQEKLVNKIEQTSVVKPNNIILIDKKNDSLLNVVNSEKIEIIKDNNSNPIKDIVIKQTNPSINNIKSNKESNLDTNKINILKPDTIENIIENN